jgi:hypothetical protein
MKDKVVKTRIATNFRIIYVYLSSTSCVLDSILAIVVFLFILFSFTPLQEVPGSNAMMHKYFPAIAVAVLTS